MELLLWLFFGMIWLMMTVIDTTMMYSGKSYTNLVLCFIISILFAPIITGIIIGLKHKNFNNFNFY